MAGFRASTARRCVGVALALMAFGVAAPAAHADYRFSGHGFGHGVGLAQYGAMGYARNTNHTWRWIVGHYFPGTSREAAPSARIRVLIKQTSAGRIGGADRAVDATGRSIAIDPARAYRFPPWEADGVEMIDLQTGHVRAHLHTPVRLTGSSRPQVIGPADNGVTDGRYRGTIVLQRSGPSLLVVDDLGLESYLYGVVPAEMPASWPAEALRAQAVTARSYARTSLRPAEPFDVYADTRSQVYRGYEGEATRTTSAVDATRAIVVMSGGAVAHTLFHSSSGGRTAAVEEVFGGPPVSYLRSVDDPYDTVSPYHDWTTTLTDAQTAQRLDSVTEGDLVDLQVASRTPSGRAGTVRVVGSAGTRVVAGTTVRSLLGLRSTWFSISRPSG